MITAKLVDVDDLTAIDATDPATSGIIYRYYNNDKGIYDFFLTNSVEPKKIAFEPDTWILIEKQSDEARNNNTTLANDAELKITMEGSRTYSIKITVFFDTVAAADFKYALTGPSSPTLVRVRRQHLEPGGAAFTDAVDTSYTGSTSVTGGGTTGGYLMFDIIVQNGANNGVFAFQWAQDTSDAGNTKVLSGSWLMYNSIAQALP